MKLSVTGKTVVITGTIPGMERKDAEAKLKGLGAKVTSSISKNTDFLFAMDDAGSKKSDADRLGVLVLGSTELFAMIGKPGATPKQPKTPITAEAKKKVKARAPKPAKGFDGVTVVITGTLSAGRDEIAERLEAAGAKDRFGVGEHAVPDHRRRRRRDEDQQSERARREGHRRSDDERDARRVVRRSSSTTPSMWLPDERDNPLEDVILALLAVEDLDALAVGA